MFRRMTCLVIDMHIRSLYDGKALQFSLEILSNVVGLFKGHLRFKDDVDFNHDSGTRVPGTYCVQTDYIRRMCHGCDRSADDY